MALHDIEQSQVVHRHRAFGRIGPERFFRYGERPLAELLGFRVAGLVFIHPSQIGHYGCDIRMIWPERSFLDCQRPFEQWLGIDVAALDPIERGRDY